MKKVLFQFDDVVDVLGGPKELARLTGNFPHAIWVWRRKRGRFPCRHYFVIKFALEELGFAVSIALFNFSDAAENMRKAA